MSESALPAQRLRVALLALHFAEYSASLAVALAKHCDVLLILSERNARAELANPEALAGVAGLRLVLLPHHVSPLLLVQNIVRITRLVRSFRPDVVHCQEELKDYLIGALPFLPRVPFVLTVHDPKPHAGRDAARMQWSRFGVYERWLRAKADHVVVHGDTLAAAALEVMPRLAGRIHVVPHGPLGVLEGGAQRTDWQTGRCLLFGRMEQYKGVDFFVQAIRLLRARGYPVTGVLAGRGDALDAIKQGLSGDDAFIVREGFLRPEDVVAEVDAANVVVLPYIEGTQSGVAALALGRGRPLVVTQVGSLPDMVQHGESGLVVAPRDAEALAVAIGSIVSSTQTARTMGAASLAMSAGSRSWASIAGTCTAIYAAARRRSTA